MAISVQCPRCGQHGRTTGHAAGAAVLCPGCGNHFTARGTEPGAADDAPRVAAPPPRRSVLLVAAAALACTAAVAWAYRGHPPEKPRAEEQLPPDPELEENLRQEMMLERQTQIHTWGGERRAANQSLRKGGTGR
jgi:hypothetical protein